MDPPYKEKKLPLLFKKIILSCSNQDGVIIIHRHKKEEDEFPKEFQIIEEKTYGISKIVFGNLI